MVPPVLEYRHLYNGRANYFLPLESQKMHCSQSGSFSEHAPDSSMALKQSWIPLLKLKEGAHISKLVNGDLT